MKNIDFFYQQYEKISWENQEITNINSLVYEFIIKKIITKKKGNDVKIFDIGFGIGTFIKTLYQSLEPTYKNIVIEGCEPSDKNFNYFMKKNLSFKKGNHLKAYNSTFLNTDIDKKFDFITAIYVFPHFISDELEKTVEKIKSMLKSNGQFILVVANESYIEEKLKSMKDLFIERNIIKFDDKKYREVLHYSDIPEIGKLIDYNREEQYYLDLFKKYGFTLKMKENLDDNGFICTIFIFQIK